MLQFYRWVGKGHWRGSCSKQLEEQRCRSLRKGVVGKEQVLGEWDDQELIVGQTEMPFRHPREGVGGVAGYTARV